MIEILDFYAEWCGPCKSLAPIVDEIVNEKGIKLTKIDTEQDSENLCGKYRVRGIPTLIFLKDGEMVGKTVGLVTRDEVLENIKKCE